QRLDVRLHALHLAVGDEDDAIHALEDELAGGVVEHLAGHGVEMEAGLESPDLSQRQGKEVEEEGAVRLGGEADELALRLRIGLVVDVLEIGGLPAKTRAVIDDLAVDLSGRVVDEGHGFLKLL